MAISAGIASEARQPNEQEGRIWKGLAPQVGFGSEYGVDKHWKLLFRCNASKGIGQKWLLWTTDLSHVTNLFAQKT
jgi:hypothetical protein